MSHPIRQLLRPQAAPLSTITYGGLGFTLTRGAAGAHSLGALLRNAMDAAQACRGARDPAAVSGANGD